MRCSNCYEAEHGPMPEPLDTYDWSQAFVIATGPEAAVPFAADPVGLGGFGRGDVAEVLHHVEGEHDGEDWLMVGRLRDGRFFYLSAGCDYTGWDCQAGGRKYVASTLDAILRFGPGARDRERLGVTLPSTLPGVRRES